MEFPDLDAAEREAAEAAAEIGRERLPTGAAREVTIEVSDRERQRPLIKTVSLEVHRVHPRPRPG